MASTSVWTGRLRHECANMLTTYWITGAELTYVRFCFCSSVAQTQLIQLLHASQSADSRLPAPYSLVLSRVSLLVATL